MIFPPRTWGTFGLLSESSLSPLPPPPKKNIGIPLAPGWGMAGITLGIVPKMLARHPPKFCSISTVNKKMIFPLNISYQQLDGVWVKWKTLGANEFHMRPFPGISWTPLEHITTTKAAPSMHERSCKKSVPARHLYIRLAGFA